MSFVVPSAEINSFGQKLDSNPKAHLKMLAAEVVCCKKLSYIADELGIEANSVDPEQTVPIGAV